jgi:hypothetical protein
MAQPVWNTPVGSIGVYPSTIPLTFQLSATAVLPASSVRYTLLSGTLPAGLSLTLDGLIYGTPTLVSIDAKSTFTVRATDNLNNIKDRTFSIEISGSALPQLTTPSGSILSTQDSVWVDFSITFSNPDPTNEVSIQLLEGTLPPGLEIDPNGNIRGYPEPPIVNVTLPNVITTATETSSSSNLITCVSTTNFAIGRPVIFYGTVFGSIEANTTYYIKTIDSSTSFSISTTQFGPTFPLTYAVGVMGVNITSISTGQPTIRTYPFTLGLSSDLGSDSDTYSITVINQNTPVSQGGPGKQPNSRIPTILNTRPLTFNITSDPYYGYYVLPPVAPSTPATIGTIKSGDFFAFKAIGYDFDGSDITYSFSGLPYGLTGNTVTGWITGYPTLNTAGISSYDFSVAVWKKNFPSITTPYFNFNFSVSNDVSGVITWVSPSNLGTILNGTVSTLSVVAESDTPLSYKYISGTLPPNLTITSNGEISGYVADQPTTKYLEQGSSTEFTFTVQAYSPQYPIVQSTKTFTVTVYQEFSQPTDILYIKATPSISDRQLIDSLLTDDTLIPPSDLYRPTDQYFGKADSVIYEHAYGIYASSIDQYIASVTTNHYWRNITLGQLKTAVAKNDAGEVIYEVVYSEVIDNLVNPQGVSVSNKIYWPKPIDLGLGPWYTSITDIFTSYEEILGQQYYTSLTPGYARNLYPNSLFNMRNKVANSLGQEFNSKLLPLWMTSQQANGDTLGYTQAWVICYTLPGKAESIKTNIDTKWGYLLNNSFVSNRLNTINFQIDRFTVDKSTTYNYDNTLSPPAWTGLPSADPAPDPIDSKDFYVLFPRQTILPDQTQY